MINEFYNVANEIEIINTILYPSFIMQMIGFYFSRRPLMLKRDFHIKILIQGDRSWCQCYRLTVIYVIENIK